ncbi:hypothetical protein SLEP1_g1464 [Rubroshorea leprosula]|nr:hypothetical protein SLEP1_g1464 [Rubroshorea leprosula]
MLERGADSFHLVGMKKGVDGGQVSLRAWVQKPSLQSAILASNQSGFNKSLFRFFSKKETCDDIKAIDAVRCNPNSMEFVFEVEDTGKGIPNEKQVSFFESFVQVKDTATRRFNVFLETATVGNIKGENEPGENLTVTNGAQHSGLTIQIPNPSLNNRTPSPRLGILSSSPKLEGSQVVLLIQNNGRRGTFQKYRESLGINVSVVERWEQLFSVLEKIKSKRKYSTSNSIGKLGLCSRSDNANCKDLPLSTTDGTEQKHQSCRKKASTGFILLVIDAGAGPFDRNSMRLCLNSEKTFRILVRQFGWTTQLPRQSILKRKYPRRKMIYGQTEMQEIHVDSSKKKLWSGKRILVAEDVLILGKVTMKKLEQDSAIVEVCKNGEEALNLVRNDLRDQREKGASYVLPYDYILMDCEMPVMDGLDATRRKGKRRRSTGYTFQFSH